jgi:ATP-dependent exoDNAse (exonuclease V) beta subunit
MSRKPASARHRKDLTAKSLIALVQHYGARYLPLDGTVDGLIEQRGTWWIVDWKTPGATLTPAQAKLVASGWKIEFISTSEQLEQLLGGQAA